MTLDVKRGVGSTKRHSSYRKDNYHEDLLYGRPRN